MVSLGLLHCRYRNLVIGCVRAFMVILAACGMATWSGAMGCGSIPAAHDMTSMGLLGSNNTAMPTALTDNQCTSLPAMPANTMPPALKPPFSQPVDPATPGAHSVNADMIGMDASQLARQMTAVSASADQLSNIPSPMQGRASSSLRPFLRQTIMTSGVLTSTFVSFGLLLPFKVHAFLHVATVAIFITALSGPTVDALMSCNHKLHHHLLHQLWVALQRASKATALLGRYSLLTPDVQAAISGNPRAVGLSSVVFMQLLLGFALPTVGLYIMESRSDGDETCSNESLHHCLH